MKAFLAYRHTGESLKNLEHLLGDVRDALAVSGIDAYCTFFDEAEFQNKSLNARQIMEHAFEMIDTRDLLFVIQTSENKSEGMLMEVGYCVAKSIPIVVAVRSDVRHTYLPEMGDIVISWKDIDDLHKQIKNTDFSVLTKS